MQKINFLNKITVLTFLLLCGIGCQKNSKSKITITSKGKNIPLLSLSEKEEQACINRRRALLSKQKKYHVLLQFFDKLELPEKNTFWFCKYKDFSEPERDLLAQGIVIHETLHMMGEPGKMINYIKQHKIEVESVSEIDDIIGDEYLLIQPRKNFKKILLPYIPKTPKSSFIYDDLKKYSYLSKLSTYFLKKSEKKGNNFYLILDEWNAYNETFIFDLTYPNIKCNDMKNKADYINSVQEFEFYTFYYLAKLKKVDSATYEKLYQNKKNRTFIRGLSKETEWVKKQQCPRLVVKEDYVSVEKLNQTVLSEKKRWLN